MEYIDRSIDKILLCKDYCTTYVLCVPHIVHIFTTMHFASEGKGRGGGHKWGGGEKGEEEGGGAN